MNFKFINTKSIALKVIISVFLIQFSNFVFAQSTKEFDKKWELAKGHYEDKNYDLALMLFKSLTSENSENPYVEYANFYTALTLFNQDKLKDSRQYLLQLQNKYPYWSKVEDVKYLHANIEFKLENHNKALELLGSCNSKHCINLKFHYLSKVESFSLLEKLKADFPNDREINAIYCFRLANKNPLFQADKDTLYKLIDKFDIKNSKLKNVLETSNESHFKDTFNVAILYPFFKQQLQNNISKRRNQFVIDHYWGIKEAIDTLSKSGIQIKLHLYDTENDTNKVKVILTKSELKQMDLLVGPIYSQNGKYVSKFASENQIINFNPLLKNNETITDSGFVFLYNPIPQSIGTKAAEFVLDSFSNKKIMLICFEDEKDTVIANAFIKRLSKDSVQIAKKLILKRNTDVLSALSKVKNEDVEVIFAPSENSSIATNLLSWQIIREVTFPVIGNSKWLETREYNINQANEFKSYYFDTDYRYSNVDSTNTYEENYFKNYNIPATEASYKGYDLGLFIGHNLAKYGKYFNQALWNMDSQQGVFYPEFNYTNSYFNNFVPILKLEDYQLIPMNFKDRYKLIEETSNE